MLLLKPVFFFLLLSVTYTGCYKKYSRNISKIWAVVRGSFLVISVLIQCGNLVYDLGSFCGYTTTDYPSVAIHYKSVSVNLYPAIKGEPWDDLVLKRCAPCIMTSTICHATSCFKVEKGLLWSAERQNALCVYGTKKAFKHGWSQQIQFHDWFYVQYMQATYKRMRSSTSQVWARLLSSYEEKC